MFRSQRLDRAADAGRHHRQAEGHGFEHRQRQPLEARRQDEEIGDSHETCNIGPLAEELHMRLKSQLFDQRPDSILLLALADEEQDHRRICRDNRRHGADQGDVIFLPGKPGDREENFLSRKPEFGPEGLLAPHCLQRENSVPDDGYPVGSDTVALEAQARRLGNDDVMRQQRTLLPIALLLHIIRQQIGKMLGADDRNAAGDARPRDLMPFPANAGVNMEQRYAAGPKPVFERRHLADRLDRQSVT